MDQANGVCETNQETRNLANAGRQFQGPLQVGGQGQGLGALAVAITRPWPVERSQAMDALDTALWLSLLLAVVFQPLLHLRGRLGVAARPGQLNRLFSHRGCIAGLA